MGLRASSYKEKRIAVVTNSVSIVVWVVIFAGLWDQVIHLPSEIKLLTFFSRAFFFSPARVFFSPEVVIPSYHNYYNKL